MPGLDGFQTCRILRGRSGLEALPVLMLTGLEDEASITRAYDRGGRDGFLRQVHAVEPARSPAPPAACVAHATSSKRSKAKRSPERRTWHAWAASTGDLAVGRAAVFGRRPTRARRRRRRRNFSLRRALRLVPSEARAEVLGLLRQSLRHASALAADNTPVALRDGKQRIIHLEAEPEFNERGSCAAIPASCRTSPTGASGKTASATLPTPRHADRPAQPDPAQSARRARSNKRAGWATRSRCPDRPGSLPRSSTTRSGTPPATSC